MPCPLFEGGKAPQGKKHKRAPFVTYRLTFALWFMRVALVSANNLYLSAPALASEKTVRERRKEAVGKHKRTFIEFSPCFLKAGKESTIEKERKTLANNLLICLFGYLLN